MKQDEYQPLTKKEILDLLVEAKKNTLIMVDRDSYEEERRVNISLGEESRGDPEWTEAYQRLQQVQFRLREGVVPREDEEQFTIDKSHVEGVYISLVQSPSEFIRDENTLPSKLPNPDPELILSLSETELEVYAQQLFEMMQLGNEQ